jgi:TonB-linked SusC/RagA family outer membrane protein
MGYRIRAKRLLSLAATAVLLGMGAVPLAAQAAGTIRGKVVEAGTQRPINGAQITVVGTGRGTLTNASGDFLLPAVPAGQHRVRAQFIGFAAAEQTVTVVAGQSGVLNFTISPSAVALDELVVTALGETVERRAIGTAQQTVRGVEVAQTQRENFVNALQGRIAGVDVTSTSGVPGASSQITIRGVSSISSSNQPLFIIDGLPLDNTTLNSNVLASETSGTAFSNRGVDFTNRAADINPEDIESITVLKGPEAAVLYGIDAANGAIVITTKRGRPGTGGFEYSNSFRVESTRARPEIQQAYGISSTGSQSFLYWGEPFAAGTQFFDNVAGFFQTATTQRHNLGFSGAAADNSVNYRVTASVVQQEGVVPGSVFDRYNLTGAGQAQVTPWMNVDLTSQYIYSENDQPFKGAGGPLLGLLVWPQTDQASEWQTEAGTRRRLTNLSAAAEIDNPWFNVIKNRNATANNRFVTNLGVRLTPFRWGNLRLNIGSDSYANNIEIIRHPESGWGASNNGVIDVANENTRNLSTQALLTINPVNVGGGLTVRGLVGNQIRDDWSQVDAMWGRDFLEPDFRSVNNASVRTSRTSISQRRLIGAFARATFEYNRYLTVNFEGRNDWTSTIPVERNSFFYPGISSRFVFSEAIPAIGERMTGSFRAAYAQTGRDARPYAFRPSLVNRTTSHGGYGYGFTGPNLNLRPEFAHSYEFGADLGFFDNRLGVDATVYRKETEDQIVNDIRGSYGTGFILFNLNGASTRNEGLELTVRGTPMLRRGFSWEVLANFDRSRGTVIALPNELPESYNSDTWLYGNVRAGNMPGLSTRSMTGLFWLRNDAGELLIDPTTGLPVRSTTFIDAGHDRQPDWTLGLNNTFNVGRASLSFLLDIRRGGDILNATEHFLTARGLTTRTLDRETPRVIRGVLRDGLENSPNPTQNNIVVVPAIDNGFYLSASEELFIEKDVNWLRLRDVTLNVRLPERRFGRTSVFVTGTDLFLLTNYSGLDPIVNGNSAAVGGSGGVGIDFGNFPMPRGLNFGIRTNF